MNTQPEALRLAYWIERGNYNHEDVTKAATELRRLSAIENEWARMSQDEGEAEREIERLRAVNQELLEALLLMVATHDEPAGFVGKYGRALDEAINKQQLKIDARLLKARLAIAKAEKL
jgi:hypothetical protein